MNHPRDPGPAARRTVHPILRILALAAAVLGAGALVLVGHIALQGDPGHRTSGDILFYGVLVVPVLVATGIAIARQRAS